MKNERFVIRAYGKSELAMLYLPHHTEKAAMNLFRTWIKANPRLSKLKIKKGKYYLPYQVKIMVEELGEPFDLMEDKSF